MKLYNIDISEKYQKKEFFLMQKDFMSAFSYWVVFQSPYASPDITEPLKGFHGYISEKIGEDEVKKMMQKDIWDIINEKAFENIPEIERLNHAKIERKGFIASSSRYHRTKPEYDYIDLTALASNIGYMIMREKITN